MAEVKWIKITTNIFDDDKIRLLETLPDGDSLIVIWFKLLALAGKQNFHGFLMMNERIAYTDEMLHTIFNRPLPLVRLALQSFEQFGMVEIIDNRYYITNWEKHQSIDALDKIREQTRKRVASHRERAKIGNVTGNVTVTQCNATDIDIDIETEREEEYKEDVKEELTSRKFVDLVANNLGRGLVQFEYDMLNDYLLKRGVSKELFLEAVKVAVANNVRKFNYICRILDNWLDSGVQTVEQAYQAQMDFKAKKANRGQQSQTDRVSNVPEWTKEAYRTEPTAEELEEMEKLKQRMTQGGA